MSLVPQPQSVTLKDGVVELASLDDVVEAIDTTLHQEGYTIDISATAGVRIRGGSSGGLFYARQTLLQLLPPSALRHGGCSTTRGRRRRPWALPAQVITDAPTSGLRWRGCMLDAARHFMPVADVLRLVDALAHHKLNTLHLHLTDDQGWRIDVPGWPRLAAVASWRRRTMQGTRHQPRWDARPHGGFYSADDLKEIVAFAEARHVTVVPEVNMPGHMQAAIAAYPELGNTDVEGRSVDEGVWDSWGVSRRVLNVSDQTLGFCRSVLDFVCSVFPAETIGIGGDECPYDEWKASAAAQARMRALGIETESALQGWFTGQMAAHLASHGRRAYAWDEVVEGYTGPPGKVLVAAWRGPGATGKAARRGFDVVACPDVDAYLDYRQSDDKGEPTPVGTLLPLERVYTFAPVPANLEPDAARRVVGAQVNVWTEHMESARRVEYMMWPRACAFAEVAWGRKVDDGEEEEGGFAGFRRRLEEKHLARLEALGVNYRPQTGPRPWDSRPDAVGHPLSQRQRPAGDVKDESRFE
ncbi:beta-hexosaminidase [Beauveria brongniartii RCEF 3172]|uniref:beta-N-acetylhexosaminidase n=1 Tax=Beauveria brongniartii RCEF 3172 TaxID=1081107 RepID=A0A167EKC4_9HYPO|nr:beta-hexosaminidase [Beauveria brongniartii RCEF 3172]